MDCVACSALCFRKISEVILAVLLFPAFLVYELALEVEGAAGLGVEAVGLDKAVAGLGVEVAGLDEEVVGLGTEVVGLGEEVAGLGVGVLEGAVGL